MLRHSPPAWHTSLQLKGVAQLIESLLALMLLGAAAPEPPQRQAWRHYSGPCNKVVIQLERDGGWGGGPSTFLLNCSGGTMSVGRRAAFGASRYYQDKRALAFDPVDFTLLVNEFYAARFFQLDSLYGAGALSLVLEPYGSMTTHGAAISDASTSRLTVTLGDYTKQVSFSEVPGMAPAYLVELARHVEAFAIASAVRK